jgi:hypothetical protein
MQSVTYVRVWMGEADTVMNLLIYWPMTFNRFTKDRTVRHYEKRESKQT